MMNNNQLRLHLDYAGENLFDCPTQLYLDFHLCPMTNIKEHSREICRGEPHKRFSTGRLAVNEIGAGQFKTPAFHIIEDAN